MKAPRLLPLAALGLFATGCAHYRFPVNQLETPEARGTGEQHPNLARLELLGILSGSDLIAQPTLVPPPAGSTAAPTPMVQQAMGPAFGLSLSFSDRIDGGIRLSPEAPVSLRFKYQFAGAPESKSVPGSFSASVCAAPGMLIGRDGTSSTFFVSGDLSVPVGYRLSASHLVSVIPFYGFASVSGLTQSAAGNSPGSVSASRMGAGLGYQYTLEALFTRAEVAYATGSVGAAQISGFFLGASFGFSL